MSDPNLTTKAPALGEMHGAPVGTVVQLAAEITNTVLSTNDPSARHLFRLLVAFASEIKRSATNDMPNPTTTIQLRPGCTYRAGDDTRYLAGLSFDGQTASVMWAVPVVGSPWRICEAHEFRAWIRDNDAKEINDVQP